jgi:uncharacterized protein
MHITGETRYLDAAERALRIFYPQMEAHPGGFATLAMALDESLKPPGLVVLRGAKSATRQWQRGLRGKHFSRMLLLPIGSETGHLPPVLDKAVGDPVNAWVCYGVKCLPPISQLTELENLLVTPV